MDEPTPTSPAPPPRWFLPLVGTGIVTLIAATNIGNVVWPCAVATPGAAPDSGLCSAPVFSWFEGNPYGLLMLNSSNKYLLATSVLTELVPFALIALIRLSLPDPLFFLLGLRYRGKALNWARQVFPGMDPVFDQFESQGGMTRNALGAAVFIAPNNPVCLLAGIAAMPWKRFLALSITGTICRIALMRGIGTLFSDQIEDVLDLVARYQRWLTLGSLLLVVAYVAYQVVGRKGLVGGVESLEDELGED